MEIGLELCHRCCGHRVLFGLYKFFLNSLLICYFLDHMANEAWIVLERQRLKGIYASTAKLTKLIDDGQTTNLSTI